MTSHRRAVLLRVSAVVVMTAGAIAGVAAPAQAAPTTITLNENSFEVAPSLTPKLRVRLSGDTTPVSVTVTAPASLGGELLIKGTTAPCPTAAATIVTCEDVVVPGTGNKELVFDLVAKSPSGLKVNETKSGTGTVKLSFDTGSTKEFSVNLKGPDKAAPVPEVSGRVIDSVTALPLKDAVVVIEDGANVTYQTGADTSGRFKLLSTAAKPITPGQIKIGAMKDGFETVPLLVDGKSGVALANLVAKLKPLTGPSMTALPEITDTQPATDPSAGTTQGNGGAAAPPGGGPGMLSWVLIALGGLLVLLGIGAIVLLLRRRGDDDDGEDEPAPTRPTRRGPTPATAGARGGPGGGPGGYREHADPTMVSRAPMGSPTSAARNNLHDATAIVRPAPVVAPPPRASYPTSPGPNSYGSPPAPQSYAGPNGAGQPGYGASSGGAGYGNEPGYGPSGGYGPSSRPAADGYGTADYAGGGYGPGGAGYGPAPASPASGYAPPASGYGEEDSTHRYDGGGGYGGGAAPYNNAGGYEPQQGYSSGRDSGYEQPRDNGYEQPRGGGYEAPAGYDRDGYDRAPEPRASSYDAGGYGPSSYDGAGGRSGHDSGYSQPPPAPPARGGDRRSLDWLDD